jgi:hypothetical protein
MAGRKKNDEAAEPEAETVEVAPPPVWGGRDPNAEPVEKGPDAIDETIPGGLYIVDGLTVNAEGQEITKTGRVKDTE